MTALRRFFSFPLLAKELTEAAARRRTYVLRVAYAVLLFALFAMLTPRSIWTGNPNVLTAMGGGRRMFDAILILQYFGIALFLPAMMCGRITSEKERDSLVLLFLTDLRPWAIILEKYIGGLVPMLSFLLLAMPLAAIAYAFGGVAPEEFATGLYLLLLGTLQVGALSLACSAWYRTTVGAFIATYLLGTAFYLSPVLFLALYRLATTRNLGPNPHWLFYSHIPPVVSGLTGSDRFATVLLHSTPVLVSIALFLFLARVFLVRRAFAPASQFFRRLFARLDRLMQRANRLTGHRMILRPGSDLPGTEPIAWREMSRRSLGKAHHLVRVLLVVQIPVVAIAALCTFDLNSYSRQSDAVAILAAVVGTLAVLALSVQASNTLVSERVQQTLEVLLTTPLSGREIVAQKARALRRFMLVLAIPLLTVYGVECYVESDLSDPHKVGWFGYAVCAALTVAIYLPLVSWLSLWIGLKMRTRFKAIVTAIGVTVAWCGVPILGGFLSSKWLHLAGRSDEFLGSLIFLSPIIIVVSNELGELHEYANLQTALGGWFFIAINFTFYGVILLALRHRTLASADRYLRR